MDFTYPYKREERNLLQLFFFIFIHLLTCVYIVRDFSLPPTPLLSPSFPLSLPGRTYSVVISNFVEEKT
jgi:hypothetical protein